MQPGLATRPSRSTGSTFRATTLVVFLASSVFYAAALVVPVRGLIDYAFLGGFLAGCTVTTLAILQRRRALFIPFWLGLVVWQNAVLGLLLSARPGPSFLIVVEFKTVMIYLAALHGLASNARWLKRELRPLLGPAAVTAAAIVVSSRHPAGQAAIGYGRNFTSYIALVVAFSWCLYGLTIAQIRTLCARCARYVILVLGAGAAIEYSIGTDAWRSILNYRFTEAYLNGASVSTTLFDHRVPRLGSVMIEPVNAGYLAAGAVVVLLICSDTRRRRGFLALGIVLTMATFAKGALLLLLLIAMAGIATRTFRTVSLFARRLPTASIVLATAGTLGAFIAYLFVTAGPARLERLLTNPTSLHNGGGESVEFHMAGLLSALYGALSNPIGRGLGTGGNFSSIFGGVQGAVRVGSGAESGVGVLVAQMGLLGLLGLGWFAIRLTGIIDPGRSFYGRAAVVAWFVLWWYQENVMGPQASALVLLGISAALAMSIAGRRERALEQQQRGLPPATVRPT